MVLRSWRPGREWAWGPGVQRRSLPRPPKLLAGAVGAGGVDRPLRSLVEDRGSPCNSLSGTPSPGPRLRSVGRGSLRRDPKVRIERRRVLGGRDVPRGSRVRQRILGVEVGRDLRRLQEEGWRVEGRVRVGPFRRNPMDTRRQDRRAGLVPNRRGGGDGVYTHVSSPPESAESRVSLNHTTDSWMDVPEGRPTLPFSRAPLTPTPNPSTCDRHTL